MAYLENLYYPSALLICLSVGALFSFLDLHRFITKDGGTAPVSYLRSFHFYVFVAIIGTASVILFVVSTIYPGGWVDKALGLESTNFYLKALFIAVSSTVLIRSKLFEVRNTSIGLDYAYDLFRSWIANRYKAFAAVIRADCAREWSLKTSSIAGFDRELIAMVKNATDHREKEIKSQIDAEFKTIESMKASNQIKEQEFHNYLLRTAIDYVGIKATSKWIEKQVVI